MLDSNYSVRSADNKMNISLNDMNEIYNSIDNLTEYPDLDEITDDDFDLIKLVYFK